MSIHLIIFQAIKEFQIILIIKPAMIVTQISARFWREKIKVKKEKKISLGASFKSKSKILFIHFVKNDNNNNNNNNNITYLLINKQDKTHTKIENK